MNFVSLSTFTFTSFPIIPDGVTSLACGVRAHCLPCSRTSGSYIATASCLISIFLRQPPLPQPPPSSMPVLFDHVQSHFLLWCYSANMFLVCNIFRFPWICHPCEGSSVRHIYHYASSVPVLVDHVQSHCLLCLCWRYSAKMFLVCLWSEFITPLRAKNVTSWLLS
jgi:hypothetical protein